MKIFVEMWSCTEENHLDSEVWILLITGWFKHKWSRTLALHACNVIQSLMLATYTHIRFQYKYYMCAKSPLLKNSITHERIHTVMNPFTGSTYDQSFTKSCNIKAWIHCHFSPNQMRGNTLPCKYGVCVVVYMVYILPAQGTTQYSQNVNNQCCPPSCFVISTWPLYHQLLINTLIIFLIFCVIPTFNCIDVIKRTHAIGNILSLFLRMLWRQWHWWFLFPDHCAVFSPLQAPQSTGVER